MPLFFRLAYFCLFVALLVLVTTAWQGVVAVRGFEIHDVLLVMAGGLAVIGLVLVWL